MRSATEIILQSIAIDPTKTRDLERLLRGCNSQASRAAAVRGYCDRTMMNRLTVEKNVVPSLMASASWDEIALKLDDLLSKDNRHRRLSVIQTDLYQ